MAKKRVKVLLNPFVCEGYAGPEYFFDRTEETEELISNLWNGRNITLISPRRIGKTGLIKHVFSQIQKQEKDAVCIYVDIFSTKNQHDFAKVLGTCVLQQMMSRGQKMLNHVLEFFGSWRPVFSADPLTGSPSVSISIEEKQSAVTIKSIFDYLNQSTCTVYIAIDEFQQITQYSESGTEALLRSYIQFIPNVHFIFSGSKMHLMAQMFHSPQRPFYQSTASMGLKPIIEDIYYEFARRPFESRNGSLSPSVFHYLYVCFDGITSNIQQVLNRLYEVEHKVEDEQQVNNAIQYIVNRLSMQYETLTTFLTYNQFVLLKNIARCGHVESPQSGKFIKQNDLPSASSVKAALTVLLDKEMVYHDNSGYFVYDRFFDLWLKRLP